MFLMGPSMVSTACVGPAAVWFAVRCGGLLNSDTFMAGDPWVFSHSCFSWALQWCRPPVWGQPPCGLQFVAADSGIQTLLWLAILGFLWRFYQDSPTPAVVHLSYCAS
ncbi:hypothetical protein K438DRAFT_1754524 [Mycena galopus ATCC 62051]|nr:hypothetical protein K438DRAFT_1754524 [Mycena galopus ATCC 62051]